MGDVPHVPVRSVTQRGVFCRARLTATKIDQGTAAAGQVTGTARVKRGMAEMLKGGVIMDVVTPEQAKIAEDAGAVAVMALERVPGRHPGRRAAWPG